MRNYDSDYFLETILTETYEVEFRGKVYLFSATTEIPDGPIDELIEYPLNICIRQIGEGKFENGKFIWTNYDEYPPIFNEFDPYYEIVMDWFLDAKIWDGKSFWEVESEMSLVWL